MNIYQELPSPNRLIAMEDPLLHRPLKVNGHFHTPYSFSAFNNLEQVMKMAVDEGVDILGINDFYTMAGYVEFAELCLRYRKFPLFNIEFMGLLQHAQDKGIRINDPKNPGRIYFSGKGLDFPVSLEGDSLATLQSVRAKSDRQSRKMVEKTSAYLSSVDPDLALDYDTILEKHTRGMVRERHIARAIREKVFETYPTDPERKSTLSRIVGGVDQPLSLDDHAGLEGTLRSALLKAGGTAYVKEDANAFPDIGRVIAIILDAGGIPCYPVLLDDPGGSYTEFESDPETLLHSLTSMNVFSVELIPGRNRIEHLRSFVRFFDEHGFVITFGTEHNTPLLDPISVSASGRTPLDEYLLQVSYKGACITAAHQYFRSHGQQGYVNAEGGVIADREEFYRIGHTLIHHFIHHQA
jgi:hypothetical protein